MKLKLLINLLVASKTKSFQRNYFTAHKNKDQVKLKKGYAPDKTYLVDEDAIKLLVKSLSPNLAREKSVIIEACPGPGLLLEALLVAGAPKVRGLIDNSSPYKSVLEGLKMKYPNQLELCNLDLIHMKRNFGDNPNIESSKKLLETALQAKPVDWSDDPPIKLVITLTPNNERLFCRRILSELCLQTGIYAFGRSQIFAFISGKEYEFMKPKKLIRAHHQHYPFILYQSFFDINHIATLNWDCLHPKIIMKKSNNFDWEHVFLVSLTPKLELIDLIPSKEWSDYFYFVKQTMARRTYRIIPTMEKLVSDCGPKLIKHGITLFETWRDLEPSDFIKLFNEVRSWPEFEMSNLGIMTKEFNTSLDYSLEDPFTEEAH